MLCAQYIGKLHHPLCASGAALRDSKGSVMTQPYRVHDWHCQITHLNYGQRCNCCAPTVFLLDAQRWQRHVLILPQPPCAVRGFCCSLRTCMQVHPDRGTSQLLSWPASFIPFTFLLVLRLLLCQPLLQRRHLCFGPFHCPT